MPKSNTFTREQLHCDLWATPISKLATEYGVASYIVTKACNLLNVPRPPFGYWAKIANGHKIDIPLCLLQKKGSKNGRPPLLTRNLHPSPRWQPPTQKLLKSL
jgi:hypothetical protein